MHIVVTGAQGFVGRAVVDRLRRCGHQVTPVGRRPAPNAVQADLSQWGWTAALPERADAVLHLAQSQLYGSFPDGGPDMVRINIDSTAELLDWARRAGVGRFILTSTGNVYASSALPMDEDWSCQPTGMYPISKYAAELLTAPYDGQMSVIITRLFGIYGPGQTRGLFRTLIDRVRGGQPITLADGQGLRITPLYVDDCADALVHMAELPKMGRLIFNLGGTDSVDIRQIATRIGAVLGIAPNLQDVAGPAPSLCCTMDRTMAALDWRPTTDLATGIAAQCAALDMTA